MKISRKGIELIKKWEGCRLKAYYCPAGVLTIGYGHTGKDVKWGMVITESKAESLLVKDLEKFEKKVDKYNDKYNFNQNQFDALVSFAYNIGSIDQLTNNGKRSIDVIAQKIMLYCNANGKWLSGLYNRRLDEQRLFKSPICSGKVATVKAINGLNVRKQPTTNSKVITAIPCNNEVEVKKELDNGWLLINYGGVTGYVYGKWVSY